MSPGAPKIWLKPHEEKWDWLLPMHQALWLDFQVRGVSIDSFEMNFNALRRLGKHPAQVTTHDLMMLVMTQTAASSKQTLVSRLRSGFSALRRQGFVPADFTPDAQLPRVRKSRGVPRPFTQEEVRFILSSVNGVVKDWMLLGVYAGFRAMEVAAAQGWWLEEHDGNPMLRVFGKGKTELVIPAAPIVVDVFHRHNTQGRLWKATASLVGEKSGKEMRRLGIAPELAKFHRFRHTFATAAYQQSGGDLLCVQQLLRHQSPATSAVYAAAIPGKARNVVDAISFPTLQVM